ncbi:hypothetical protein Tco_0747438 [Tanacetum coccineum]|uniref:Uncharacterized protein n=1 Tax=Tanacetum coccineum TaxID=301880 RepID=A0ABQ4YTM0_9ASTR
MDLGVQDGFSTMLFVYGSRLECHWRVVLFFPSLGSFQPGFSLEGFLRTQSPLAFYTPDVQLWDNFSDLCFVQWFFPIGVLEDILAGILVVDTLWVFMRMVPCWWITLEEDFCLVDDILLVKEGPLSEDILLVSEALWL